MQLLSSLLSILDFVSGSVLGSQYMTFTIDPEYETCSSSETSFLQEAIAERSSGFQIYVNPMVKKIFSIPVRWRLECESILEALILQSVHGKE